MTETQTLCAACGDTGFVPPFMDACTCPAALSDYSDEAMAEATCLGVITPDEVVDVPEVVGLEEAAAAIAVEWAAERAAVAAEEAAIAETFDPPTVDTDYAAGYGEAGIYSDPSISYGASKIAKPITEAQEALVRKLIAERNPAEVAFAQVQLDHGLTAKGASRIIDALVAIPATKKADRQNSYDGMCRTCTGVVPATTGVIRQVSGRWVTFHKPGECLTAEAKAELEKDRVDEPGIYRGEVGKFYRVRQARTTRRLYAELVVPNGDGTASFVYHSKAMLLLRKSDKLSWQEARDWGVGYGCCIACGRTLSDARSLVQGWGATCGKRYGWPLVSTKQAESIISGVLSWDEVVSTAL